MQIHTDGRNPHNDRNFQSQGNHRARVCSSRSELSKHLVLAIELCPQDSPILLVFFCPIYLSSFQPLKTLKSGPHADSLYFMRKADLSPCCLFLA